jgi:NADH-quinone oxidoreductase subunit L
LKVAHFLRLFDTEVVDGTVNGLGKGTVGWSRVMQVVQSGQLHHYAIIMVIGILALITSVLILL